jgi:hypothetical protein
MKPSDPPPSTSSLITFLVNRDDPWVDRVLDGERRSSIQVLERLNLEIVLLVIQGALAGVLAVGEERNEILSIFSYFAFLGACLRVGGFLSNIAIVCYVVCVISVEYTDTPLDVFTVWLITAISAWLGLVITIFSIIRQF